MICEKKLHCMFLVETWLNSTTGVATLIEACPSNDNTSQSDKTGKEEGLQPFSLHRLCVPTLTWVNHLNISLLSSKLNDQYSSL